MKLLDCTIRDGGYINNWRFSENFFKQYLNVCNNDENIQYVEIGFLNKEEFYTDEWCGQWRYLTNDKINEFKSHYKNVKIAIMIDNMNKDLSKILPREQSNIDLIRVAFHKNEWEDALEFCKYLKSLNYEVSANLMATINYETTELINLIEKVNEYNIDYLYIADSYGNLFPKDIDNLYNLIQKYNKNAKIGLHLHNNFQNAFSNFLKGIELNIDLIDTTMYGMGRGVGNLTTEQSLCYINKNLELKNNNLCSMITFIDEYIVQEFYKNHNPWGYNLYYLISGFFDCHPNYISRLLTVSKNINIPYIWNICKKIKNNKKNQLFDKQYLEEIMNNNII